MKRYRKQPTIKIDVDISFMLMQDIAASISQITDNNGFVIDEAAYSEYLAFIDNIRVLLDMYDFDVIEPKKGPEQFKKKKNGQVMQKFKSEYLWTATRAQISANDVPEYLVLRVSDHIQQFSKQGQKMMRQREREFAEQHKRPASKRIQKYKLVNVIVNGATYHTYDDALRDIESIIVDRLGEDGIDLKIYN